MALRVAAGGVLALEGPNGAGKTSLLRMIAGLLPQAHGTIRLRTGAKHIDDAEERARFASWLGHQDGIKTQLTATENIAFFAAFFGVGTDIAETLARMGLAEVSGLPGQYLSAGQRRRLALARLLLSTRPLWLLDEPLAALDLAGRELAVGLIAGHCAAGGIAIVATHEPLGIPCTRLRLGTA